METTSIHTTASDTGMTATPVPPPKVAHAPRPRKVKQAASPARPAKPTRPVKLVIEADMYERLTLKSLRSGRTMSEIVNSLIADNLGTIVMYEKPPVAKS